MSEVVRTGISLPRRVLEELDRLIKELGINSRSKAISEAISLYWREDVAGERGGYMGSWLFDYGL